MACFVLYRVPVSDLVLKVHETFVLYVCGDFPLFVAMCLKSTKAHLQVTNK